MEANSNDNYVLVLEDRTEVKNQQEAGKLSVVLGLIATSGLLKQNDARKILNVLYFSNSNNNSNNNSSNNNTKILRLKAYICTLYDRLKIGRKYNDDSVIGELCFLHKKQCL